MSEGAVAATAIPTAGTDRVPVVDIGPLRDGSNAGAVADRLYRASSEIGFIYISNHGIDPALAAAAREAAMRFFRLPENIKRKVVMGPTHRGFIPIGDSTMYEGARPDLKETFVWGFEPADADAAAPGNRFRCPNTWPDSVPELKDVTLPYFHAVHTLAVDLMHAFAAGLGLPADTFVQTAEYPISRGSYVYYPPQTADADEQQFGVGAHTDFGVLTILNQDNVGGLQVQALDGRWIDAPPVPGTLVVNVGDLLARWTNDRYRSTPHRVINRSGRERLSLVVAYDPDYETLVDPAVACRAGEAPKYEPIRCGDYLQWRFSRSFRYTE